MNAPGYPGASAWHLAISQSQTLSAADERRWAKMKARLGMIELSPLDLGMKGGYPNREIW